MEYTGSRFQGGLSSGRPDGEGTYIFPNGSRYVGGFKNGMFEGKGTMYIPNCGAYTANWSEGKRIDGEYKFSDGLEYKEADWEYCTKNDRRFKTEIEDGIRPAGQSQLTNFREGDPKLEPNHADAGDGYVDLKSNDGIVHDYKTGETKRYVEPTETKWLMEKARIGPSGTVGRDIGALLNSMYVKNDVDGKGLTRAELIDILRDSDYSLIRTDTSFTDPFTVVQEMENDNPEDIVSLSDWLALWNTTA
jgi:hypothetical protein